MPSLKSRCSSLVLAATLVGACGSTSPSSPPSAGEPSANPSLPAASASAAPATYLKNSVVVTVSDRLRVRSQPQISDDSIKYEPVLPIGTELLVLDGPVEGSGYTWYKRSEERRVGNEGR